MSKRARLDDEACCHLDRLPNEILLRIGNYLPVQDLLNYFHLNQKLANLFAAENELWKKKFEEFNLTPSSVIADCDTCK